MTTTCELLDLLYADIQSAPALNGSYDSYFTSSPDYSPKSRVCDKLIEFCTLLREYLIHEGFDVVYKPVTGYPSCPVQNIWIYLDRTNHVMEHVAVSRSWLEHDRQQHDTVGPLMTAIHGEMLRYQEYLIHKATRESVRVQCNSCYYGGDSYCGLGREMVPDCIHRIDNQ